MRVALVTESWHPSLDGVVTRLDHTVTDLVRRGHHVLVVAPTTGPAEPSFAQARTRGFVVPFIDRRRRWGLPDPRVARVVRDFAPEVVHVVNPVLMGTSAIRRLAGELPLVVSLHTDLNAYASRYHLGATRPILRRLNQAAYRRADLALATSPTGIDLLHGLGVVDAAIWPPGVDRGVFAGDSRVPDGRGTKNPDGPLEVVCVGRLAREKHYDLLRPVVAPEAGGEQPVHLTFVGDGPDRRRLRRLFTGTPTTFVGRVHGHPLAQAYRSADAVAFTSSTDTVGLVLLEAAALGRPVVAVDTRASRDTLAGYPRARLVASDATPQAWRAAIRAAVDTPVTTAAPPSWSEVTDILVAAYARVVARCAATAPVRPGG
jgi:glycosyltransferase involved in cell wall biosynthesis